MYRSFSYILSMMAFWLNLESLSFLSPMYDTEALFRHRQVCTRVALLRGIFSFSDHNPMIILISGWNTDCGSQRLFYKINTDKKIRKIKAFEDMDPKLKVQGNKAPFFSQDIFSSLKTYTLREEIFTRRKFYYIWFFKFFANLGREPQWGGASVLIPKFRSPLMGSTGLWDPVLLRGSR